MSEDLIARIYNIDKRVAVLEERADITETRLKSMDEKLSGIFHRMDELKDFLHAHIQAEDAGRQRIMLLLIMTFAGVIGSFIYDRLVNGAGG